MRFTLHINSCTINQQVSMHGFKKDGEYTDPLQSLSESEYFDSSNSSSTSSTTTAGASANSSSSKKAAKGHNRHPHKQLEKKLRAEMWMSQSFPLQLSQLIPVLEVSTMLSANTAL
jgi:GPCR-chaperone